MKINRISSFVLFSVIILTLSQCHHKKINHQNIPTLSNIREKKEDEIIVTTQLYSAQESKKLFNTNFPAKGIYPIQIQINNRSTHNLIVRPEYFNVPLISPKTIAQALHYNTSLITWGLIATGYFGIHLFAPLIPCLIAAGPVAWNLHSENNKINIMAHKFSINGQDKIEIPPYSNLNKFIFIQKESCPSQLEIMLFDLDENMPLYFNFDITKS